MVYKTVVCAITLILTISIIFGFLRMRQHKMKRHRSKILRAIQMSGTHDDLKVFEDTFIDMKTTRRETLTLLNSVRTTQSQPQLSGQAIKINITCYDDENNEIDLGNDSTCESVKVGMNVDSGNDATSMISVCGGSIWNNN
jgi:hypothetical protein